MSTRRALYRLEGHTEADPEDLLPHLAKLLGIVDGIMFPARCVRDVGRYTAEVIGQREYLFGGVSFSVDGDAEAATWKRSERARIAMERQGWITLESDAKVKLTIEGDTVGRIACGLPSLADQKAFVAWKLLEVMPEDRPEGMISEVTLFKVDSNDSRDYAWQTEVMLPLLVHGLAGSRSTTVGRLFYHKLAEEFPVAEQQDPMGDWDKLSTIYTDSFILTIRSRGQNDQLGGEVVIPLAAS